MYNIIIYSLAVGLLTASYLFDKKKTKTALKKAKKSLLNILPELIGIVIIVGAILALLNPQTISNLLGAQSGILGVVVAAVVGAITLIPSFIAFPTAALLLEQGAGYLAITAFVSTLMMVGVATAPLEIRYFGKKATVMRNVLAFLSAFIVAIIMQMVVGINA